MEVILSGTGFFHVYLCWCVYVCVGVGVISWVGLHVLHAVSVASAWTNSAVIVAELHSRATTETLKQHSQTSAMKCVCICFKYHNTLCHH